MKKLRFSLNHVQQQYDANEYFNHLNITLHSICQNLDKIKFLIIIYFIQKNDEHHR